MLIATSCSNNNKCAIQPRSNFDGDGLIVLRRGQGQDGLFQMEFYPTCHIDTTDLVASLNKAGIGIAFSTFEWHLLIRPSTYGHIVSTFKENTKTIKLNRKINKGIHCWNCGLNEIFIIPVHIIFHDTISSYATYSFQNKINSYSIKTENETIKLKLRYVGVIEVDTITAL
ncbi:hypothetical protein H9L05_03835 [Hymenobacter qilianensis]|nr:hypothetical protein [Hymenobacter qilianensis]QNP52856.1 hypothetical protein H9L05_03835 [Hymenobacter qilianensis]